jgi:hypothetical protein
MNSMTIVAAESDVPAGGRKKEQSVRLPGAGEQSQRPAARRRARGSVQRAVRLDLDMKRIALHVVIAWYEQVMRIPNMTGLAHH